MKEIILSTLYLVALYCLNYFVFDPTYLYYEIWWLDIPMHILGGAGVASLAIALINFKNKKVTFWKIFVAVLVVALAWEIYEYICDLTNLGYWNGNWIDTVADLLNGLIGGIISYLIYKK